MAEYIPKPQVFIKKGMSVSQPGDRLTGEYFQYVQNVRSYKRGEWRQRPGMSRLYPSISNPIYYVTRINNDIDSTFRRVVAANNAGTGDLYVDDAGHIALGLVDTGYFPTQFSSVVSRPDRSPLPYLFIANSLRNSKISTSGVRTEWGISAPLSAPVVEPQGLNYLALANLTSTAGWTLTGGIALTSGSTSETVLAVLYDSGSTGMATIGLTFTAPLVIPVVDGVIQLVNSLAQSETCFILEHCPPISPPIGLSSAVIADISYDSGTTGPCTIVFTGLGSGIKRNAILRLDTGGLSQEDVRVLSVTTAIDGTPSIRCSTVNTHSAGQQVNGIASIRVFTVFTHTTASTATQSRFNVNLGGFVPTSILSTTLNLNLTQAPTSSGGSPSSRLIKANDYLNVSILDDFGALDEIQIQFDTIGVTFNQDYYYVSIRQSDLAGSYFLSSQSILAQQIQLGREQLDKIVKKDKEIIIFPPSIGELGDLGPSDTDATTQYFGLPTSIATDQGPVTTSTPSKVGRLDLQIPISQFQHVKGGSQGSLQNIVGARIVFKYNSGSTLVLGPSLCAFSIGGTYEPNTKDLPSYTYVYRGRNTSTGSRSNPSPPIRFPVESIRRRTLVTVAAHPDSQVDVIDIFRMGGTLTNYYMIGTLPVGTTTFEDNTPDSVAVRNPILEVDRYKPWISADVPKSGICNVTGTSVTRVSGDTFNTGWVRGTQIQIDGKVYTLYTNPSSTTRLELNESAGFGTNLRFNIQEPVLDGRTYPAVFGPFSGASGEFIFVVGDPRNPGYLYWTNGNDVESTSDVNSLELCPPSETLMNGVVLNGIPFCFSDMRSWRVLPSFQGGQSGSGSSFYPQETTMGRGLVGRYGICVGDAIYFVSFDGVYRTRGDALESLTDDSLAPLFDRDGTFITDFTVPVSPIDFTSPDDISLTYSFDGLYLTFKARDTNFYTFFMSFFTGGWVLDSIGTGAIIRSSRELRTQDADNVLVGTSTGKVMIRSNSSFLDDTDPISGRIWDREEIWDSLRYTKQVGDTMLDIDPAGATITPTMRYENNTSSDILSNITGSGRDQFVRDINSGSGRIVRGAAMDLTWADAISGPPKFYAWEPSGLLKAEESVNRATDWDAGGYPGTKWLQGFRLKGDTLGLAKAFQVEIDGGTFVESFSLTASGEQVTTFWLTTPVVAHEFRIRGADGDLWRNMGVEWVFEPEPEQAAVWETQVTSFNLPFFSHIREVMIAHRSTTDITMSVITDGVSNSYPIPNGGGNRIRSYLPVLALKAKYHKFRFTSSQPFGLWINDIEVRVGAWGRSDPYTIQRPFGDISRANGGARL